MPSPIRHTVVPMGSQSELSFERQVLDAFQVLRGSLIEVFASAGMDMSKPYPAARKLEVNKNLTWKASKIIRATGPQEAIRHLPGKAGMKLLLDALERHGADPEVVVRTRDAVMALDELIERHSGDKATLELMLVSMLDGGPWYDVGYWPWMFYIFFGMCGVWAFTAAVVARIHHARAPEPFQAALARAVGRV